MKLKKIIAVLSAFLIVTSLSACGKKGNSKTIEATSTEISEDVESTTSKDSTTESTDESTEEETMVTVVKETDAKGNVVTDAKGNAVTETVSVSANSKTSSNKSNSSNSSNSSSNSNNKSQTTASKNSSSKTATTAKSASASKTKQTTVAATEAPVEEDAGVNITLSDSGITADSQTGISISGSVLTITADGKYTVSGSLSNGQIVVSAPKDAKVNLHLNGVSIACSNSAPIYVTSCDSCVVHLDDGSTNYVADTASNALNGCIVSKDDITFKGNGTLNVTGNKKHGIKSSNDIKIKNGSINVSAVSAGLIGDDSVQMSGGYVTVYSCKDGIKSDSEESADKGFVYIEGGYIDIQNASGNGIEAINGITICGGTVNIHSAKQSLNCDAQSIASGCLYEY